MAGLVSPGGGAWCEVRHGGGSRLGFSVPRFPLPVGEGQGEGLTAAVARSSARTASTCWVVFQSEGSVGLRDCRETLSLTLSRWEREFPSRRLWNHPEGRGLLPAHGVGSSVSLLSLQNCRLRE